MPPGEPTLSRHRKLKVDRTQVPGEQVHLTFDPRHLAAARVNPFALSVLLHDRNVITAGGEIVASSQREINLPGALHSISDIEALPLPDAKGLPPRHLKDLVTVAKGYQTPLSAFLPF